jgi:hypothetical protein
MKIKQSIALSITLSFSFLLGFGVYLLTLAPTVTFEDSGELIAAAYNLGIPHQPGYPLFTLLGRLFSMIPIGNVAFRLNMMSAFLSALGAMFLSWSTILMIENIYRGKFKNPKSNAVLNVLKYVSGLSAGMLMVSIFEIWEQSIITEVYGLNTLFVCLFIFFSILWKQQTETTQRIRYLLVLSYLFGLALANHTTSILFIPIFLIFIWLEDRRILSDLKSMIGGLLFFILGLTPYGYLPISSARNPWMDWGNPENWTNFIRTVSRHQYGLSGSQSLDNFLAQLETYGELFFQQWVIWVIPFILILTGFSLYQLVKTKNSSAYFFIVFFIFTAPITTFLTNFNVTVADQFVASENKALVSVFYIPSYIIFPLLTGLGIFHIGQNLLPKKFAIISITVLITLVPLSNLISNYDKLDMSDYTYTEDYVRNLFSVATDNSVIFANWDPFYFPLNYYQFVENDRPDIIAIDQQLLRRSWYLQWLRDHYSQFMVPIAPEIDEFLEAVKPFEEKKPFDGNFIQTKYIAMINAIMDYSMKSGRSVYFTYTPLPEIRRNYLLESALVALRFGGNEQPFPGIDLSELKFRNYDLSRPDPDRWVSVFRNYYGGLFISRGQRHEQIGDWESAIAIYKAARIFFTPQPDAVKNIDNRITMLRGKIQN